MNNTILIVDDDPNIRAICEDILSEEGYGIEKVGSGKDALEMLSKKTFKIMLSDIQMPEMDGITLLKESRKFYPYMEVILMTAYGGLPSAIEAIRFGAYDYMTKPFSSDFLLKTIKRCMEKIDLQQKLRESQMKLVEQEKLAALGLVSAWLSHRMRNSLSVISMCAQYLQDKISPNTADLAEVLSTISAKIKTVEKMTSDFIAYSRAYDLQKTSENLNVILESAIESVSMQTQIQKVRLTKHLDPHLPDILCDPHILQETFENIILNALQAIGTQENQSIIVKSEILDGSELFLAEQPDRHAMMKLIRISVSNSGSLIPSENLEKIFVPFFTTKENGSGLGLAIVKKIVDQHGGKITVESKEKSGEKWTTIKIAFPFS